MTTPSLRRLAVYCGSSSGHDGLYAAIADELGARLGESGIDVVYGGGRVGLMGVVADAALRAGGAVIGVMTADLVRAEVAHDALTRLEVVGTMHERKALMTALADGVIVLPGGFGTLDETFEVLTWNQLGITAHPVVLLDVDGYFDHLVRFVDHGVEAGFIRRAHGAMIQRAVSVDDAIGRASTATAGRTPPKWI